QGDSGGLELLGGRFRLLGGEVGRRVGDHQVAAGGQPVHQPGDQVVRAVLVGDEVQQRDQGQRDGPAEVVDLPRGVQDGVRVAHVRLEVLGDAFLRAPEQRLRVGQHDGVVVAVDDPRVGGDALGDLVEVGLGGDAGADVEELAYAPAGQPPGGPVHERAVHPGHHRHPRVEAEHLPAHGLVDGVVVPAAQVPVVHTGRVRLAGVDAGGGSSGHEGLRKSLQGLVINSVSSVNSVVSVPAGGRPGQAVRKGGKRNGAGPGERGDNGKRGKAGSGSATGRGVGSGQQKVRLSRLGALDEGSHLGGGGDDG